MKQCPNNMGFFQGLTKTGDKIIGVKNRISCKSWSCPVCGPRRMKHTRRRIFRGKISNDVTLNGFRNKYCNKFLTLTCPGEDWRNEHTIKEAYEIISNNFTKLIKAMKKKHGHFYYFRVVEPQQDGYPHYHILLVGKNIASKQILNQIEDLWRFRYGMGFVRLNVVTRSLMHGIRYLTKYLTKSADFKVPLRGMRLFTASRGALEPIEKKEWIMKKIKIGFCRREDDEVREYDLDEKEMDKVMEIIAKDFFRYRGKTDDDIDSLEVKIKQMKGE